MAVGLAALALVAGMSACAQTNPDAGKSAAGQVKIGTTDKIVSLDPAGSYDNGSFAVQTQVFPFLMSTPYGSPDVKPDLAASASFTSPTEYTVKLKPNLKFENGHALTSSDVKFSFDRQVKIADPNGPSSLLSNLDSVSAPDATTVVFKLKSPNDQTFPQVLSSPVGPIVDEQSFSATKLTPAATIVKDKAFGGQYGISSYKENQLVTYAPNKNYQGLLGKAKNTGVSATYYTDASNMKLDVQNGTIDVAYRSLSATDIDSLRKNSKVKVWDGPGGELRFITFDLATQPFGTKQPGADPKKALAVRQAAADLIDREAIAKDVYRDTYTPAYSYVPTGLTGANESLKTLYGDGKGGPSTAKAAQALKAAGVATPVKLSLQYNPDHYGPSSGDEYARVKDQLQEGGLFTVNLQSTEWTQYSKDRVADVYPAYQLGWFPDYSDADNYLSPFFLPAKDAKGKEQPGGFLLNHYENKDVDTLINEQRSTADKTKRAQLIGQTQDALAKDLSTLPLLQGKQVAVSGTGVSGVTLDASFKFRYASLVKK